MSSCLMFGKCNRGWSDAYTTQKIPAPYTDTHTWHHHENGINMLLVPKTIHNAPLGGFPHAGGVSNSKR